MVSLLRLTTRLVVAYVRSHDVPVVDLPGLIRSVHTGLAATDDNTWKASPPERQEPVAPEAVATISDIEPPRDAADSDMQQSAREQAEAPIVDEGGGDTTSDDPNQSPEAVEASAPRVDLAQRPPRKRLGLKLATADTDPASRVVEPIARDTAAEGARDLIVLAITRLRCVDWIYNRTTMLAAPHVLYIDRGDLYVDAIALEKNGVPARERKLGRFKLAGLSKISLSATRSPNAEPPDKAAERYVGGILAAIDPAPEGTRRS